MLGNKQRKEEKKLYQNDDVDEVPSVENCCRLYNKKKEKEEDNIEEEEEKPKLLEK